MDIKAFDCWARKVMYNKKLDYLKKRKRIWERELHIDYEEEGWCDSYFTSYVRVENITVEICDGNLYGGIRELNDKRKEIILLYYFAGYTDKGISQIMDIPTSSINFNRHKALENLKEYLRSDVYAYTEDDR